MTTASNLIGSEHNEHLNWLTSTWFSSNSPICFLEGFPGTGKSTIARELMARMQASKITSIMITVPDSASDKDPTDDILLDLAGELNSAGRDELAKAIENNRPLVDVLSTLLNDPILIVIDEFQRTMHGTRAISLGGFAKVLSTLANRKWIKGRILLLTNRLVERASWSEPYEIKTLHGLVPDEGVQLLEYFAQERGRVDEISPERRREVVKWVGGNPRALRLLVSSLAHESLDDLIGVQPELWEMRDREVSAELLEDLERAILEKTLNQLSELYLINLYRLSVHRKPFRREAIEHLFTDRALYAAFKQEMIDRFLIEHNKKWFSLHPIVREIGLQKLATSETNLRQAHSLASQHYTRHFEAKQIVGWGALGGYFVEARYHLVKADRTDDLKDIATRFQTYIFSTINANSPLVNNPEELDERIAVLSALLETPGPKGLEYHLARLFQLRNQRNDLRRALHHAQRAKSINSAQSWLLCSRLLSQMERDEEAIKVLMDGIDRVAPERNLADLYNRCSTLLFDTGKKNEAIKLLIEGFDRVPPGKSLVSLYIRCSEFMHDMAQTDKALDVLKQGIERIPTDKNAADLYFCYGDLLAKNNRFAEAQSVIEQGIRNIPPDKSLASLYYLYGEIFVLTNQKHKAIEVLKQGIEIVPANKSLFTLYIRCSELLFSLNQTDAAIDILDKGTKRIPPDQGISAIYTLYFKLLITLQKPHQAIKVLLDCYSKVPMKSKSLITEHIILTYAALRDETGIINFIPSIDPELSYCIAIAEVVLYQIQGLWQTSAECAGLYQSRGIKHNILLFLESFAYLAIHENGKALDVLKDYKGKNLASNYNHYYWLVAFIQLRLGNIHNAKQALDVYCGFDVPIPQVTEAFILELWDTPARIIDNYDLAYIFPTLPMTLTGLDYAVTRLTGHKPVLPKVVKTNVVQQLRKDQDSIQPTASPMQEILKPKEEYVDFDLHIDKTGRVMATSIEGEAIDFISTDIPVDIHLSLRLLKIRQSSPDLLKDIGKRLYSWVFPPKIHTHLQQTEAVARQNNEKLRVRLRVEPPSIASVPLEFLYRESGGYFFSINPDTVLSRYLNISLPSEQTRRRQGPLHMLTIVSSPSDKASLDPTEWERIVKESIRSLLEQQEVTLDVVKNATRKEIRNALLKQKPDIVQFIGHGTYKDGVGQIALVDETNGQTWAVNDELFTNIFRGFDDNLGLICLATCHSGQSEDPQEFVGIAPKLVQQGIPAVVAMQYSVYVETVKVFLEDFYTSVAARKPVDWAVQAARNAIALQRQVYDREFGTPVLYMRAKDGEVF